MTPTDDRPPALTIRAACERAGISRRTLYREINAGRIQTQTIHTRAGTKQLIEPAVMDAWIAEYRPYRIQDVPPKHEETEE